MPASAPCTEPPAIPLQDLGRGGTGHRPNDTSAVIKRFQEASGVVLGMTRSHEMALGCSTISPAFGPVLNPYDQQRHVGGAAAPIPAPCGPCTCWLSRRHNAPAEDQQVYNSSCRARKSCMALAWACCMLSGCALLTWTEGIVRPGLCQPSSCPCTLSSRPFQPGS